MNNSLPLGYKQTEVGVIPEEWAVQSIGEITAISVGRDVQPKHFNSFQDSKYRFPVYSNTVDNFGLYGFYDFAEYQGESLTIVGRGIGLGTTFARNGGYGAIGRLLVLFPNSKTDSVFLAEYFNNRVKIHDENGGIPQLTGLSLAKYKVLLPPLPEQRAIATALSDVDALIASLDKLIAKKRDMKQAAMQELLTGKRRLPGFDNGNAATVGAIHELPLQHHDITTNNIPGDAVVGANGCSPNNHGKGTTVKSGECHSPLQNVPHGWEVKRLGEVFNISAGGDFDLKCSTSIQDEIHPYPIYSNAITDAGLYGYCSYSDHSENSITVTARGTLGCANYRNHKFTAIGRVLVLYAIEAVDGRFFSEYINSRMVFVVESTGVPQLTAPQISKYSVPVPPLPEQTAIATILSDMDTEIASLEQKRDKTRMLKQGMMQELLTGRIRLL